MRRQPPALTCPYCFLLFFFFLYLASSVSSSSSPSYKSSSSLSFSLPPPLCSSLTEAHPKKPEKNPPEFCLLPPMTMLALASFTWAPPLDELPSSFIFLSKSSISLLSILQEWMSVMSVRKDSCTPWLVRALTSRCLFTSSFYSASLSTLLLSPRDRDTRSFLLPSTSFLGV